MSSLLDSDFEDKISIIIEDQFPSFYKEEGPYFVAFVKEFYKWLETGANVRTAYFCDNKFGLNIQAGNSIITGVVSAFDEQFANGDKIAICRGVANNLTRTASTLDYEIFTINTIANSTYLTLTTDKLPEFSATNRRYAGVKYQKNPLYYGRNFLKIKDIDDTFDEFLVYFKEKYLKNISINSLVDTRTVVKHSLDLYRSKGTERSLDLLFRMVYGISPKVYYPGRDLFRLSDGTFKIPKYLEVSLKERTIEFVEKEIYGVTSGATAFCESVIRRTVEGKLIDVLYLSNIRGIFQTGEIINSRIPGLPFNECPIIIGSLTEVVVDTLGVGSGFSVGDIVTITSDKGRQAKARVANTANSYGAITTTLIDGGYGYSNTREIIISNNILKVSNFVVPANNTSRKYFEYFYDTLVQPAGIINYISANGDINVSSNVYTYHANNLLKGTGVVLSRATINSTAGELVISVLSGNMEASRFYTESNAVMANQSSYIDMSTTGNIVGIYDTIEINFVNISGTFTNGETITSSDGRGLGTCSNTFNVVGSNGTMTVADLEGIFVQNTYLIGSNSGSTANIISINLYVGVKNISNEFFTLSNNYVYSSNFGGNGTITEVSEGAGASINASSNLLYTETISINDDHIIDHVAVNLNASTWPLFTAFPTANLTNGTIEQILATSNLTIGKISALTSVNPGQNYTRIPIVKIYDHDTAIYEYEDTVIIEYSGATAPFSNNEIVTQSATSARGIVKNSSNSTHLILQNLRWNSNNQFVLTTNSTTTLVGELSGAEANCVSAQTVPNSLFFGADALINVRTNISNGSITKLDVLDSGFGFVDYETVNIIKNDNETRGIARVQSHGKSSGYYLEAGGLLSNNKHLFDGYYWQEYSYEVRSSLTLNKYSEMLKQLLHVAGTQLFGALYHDGQATFEISTTSIIITA